MPVAESRPSFDIVPVETDIPVKNRDVSSLGLSDFIAIGRQILEINLSTEAMLAALRGAPRKNAPKGSKQEQLNLQVLNSPQTRALVDAALRPFRKTAVKIAEQVARRAADVVTLATQEEVVTVASAAYGAIRPVVAPVAKVGGRVLRMEIKILGHFFVKLLKVIDTTLGILSPILSIVIGYGIKVMVPVMIAAAAGIAGVSSPLLLLSNPALKHNIRPLTEHDAERLCRAILESDVYFWQWLHSDQLHAGPLADELPDPLSDGSAIDLATYLASLQLTAQQLDARLRKIEAQLS